MATVYRFDVQCVSAFCAYPEEQIKNIIENALKEFEDKSSGLRLESITVKTPLSKYRHFGMEKVK